MSADSESNIPDNLLYTEEHEWLALDSDIGTIGITDFAQSELGDIVFVELPEVGERMEKGQSFGTVEAVKAVSDLFSPVTGEVVEVNSDLEDSADQVNTEPYGAGWMVKIRVEDQSELENLLGPKDYGDFIAE